jgi:tetratricopeptide (TPR) repeat protein
MPGPAPIFISYSHKDGAALDRLLVHLKPLVEKGLVDDWSDLRIKTGDLWEEEIERAISVAKIAVLIVSQNFYDSDFIQNHELPPLLDAAELGEVLLMPVILDDCNYLLHPRLSKFQYYNPPDKPILSLPEPMQENKWDKLAEDIEGFVRLPQSAEPRILIAPQSHHFNVPYARNPFFTGREDLLSELHHVLLANTTAALTQAQAIHGLGGIGKTQTAVEYAYRRRGAYKHIFWMRAEDEAGFNEGYVTIARLLGLPEKNEQEQAITVKAAKRWLSEHDAWLLILDNVEEPGKIAGWLPDAHRGHVLITTRCTVMGMVAEGIEVGKLPEEESALLLLRRAGLLRKDALFSEAELEDQNLARELSNMLDCLPLALDQAGAYIEESFLSLQDYIILYEAQGAKLLREGVDLSPTNHPSVTITFTLAFEKLETQSKAAADLLRLCAFLAPDAIPEEIFLESAEVLGENLFPVVSTPLLWNQTLRIALRYSLLKRDSQERTLAVHRLVQQVIREDMEEEEQRQWAERTVDALATSSPDITFEQWPLCERRLIHQLHCNRHVELYRIETCNAAIFSNQIAFYLKDRARYAEAEPLLKRSLEIWQKEFGPGHSYTALSLNNLASLYRAQGRLSEALALCERSRMLLEKTFGYENLETSTVLNNLAAVFREMGLYSEAEPLYKRALTIDEKFYGEIHQEVASALNNLALMYRMQGRLLEALPLYERALAIFEKTVGPDHPHTATGLNNLALVYKTQGQLFEALPLYERSLVIWEAALGPDHPNTASTLNNLAVLYETQGRFADAEPLLKRVVEIFTKTLPIYHPNIAGSCSNYASVLEKLGRALEAKEMKAQVAVSEAEFEKINRGT